MTIIKRTGQEEAFDKTKIILAIQAAFVSVGDDTEDPVIQTITEEVIQTAESEYKCENKIQVETIQDIVEKILVEHNFYKEAKSFILYRENRSKMRTAREHLCAHIDCNELLSIFKKIQEDFTDDEYSLEILYHKFISFYHDTMTEEEKLSALIKATVELTSQEAPQWEHIAARLLFVQFNMRLETEMKKKQINSFYEKITYLEEHGLYGDYIRKAYSKKEIESFEQFIDSKRNNLFTYSGLDLLIKRYVIRTRKNTPIETPQEMFLGIAMHLAMNEKNNRSEWVKKIYDILSKLQITVATPTLSNARKPYHQLSSCFIDTVPDSLDGIYRSIDNFARVSKFGGGMGLYFGKVRAVGSPIRGFEGAAGGIIRWIKVANDTAVAVDQLGVRQGSVAVYLDAWHKDLPEFLQLRTNNGDDRMKAHDVFPAVCYPDLFWKTVRDNIDSDWYLMCPHEIKTIKGYSIEDSWGEEWEIRYNECVADSRISKRVIPLKDLVRLILKSAVETGTPFAFFRDTVNKYNTNPQKGIIYCSNLCTEIAQNMSPVEVLQRSITIEKTPENPEGEEVITQITKPGDFVVCNLASLVLGNIDIEKEGELEDIVRTTVRALDNVIDLNYYPIEYAQITNKRYRSIGLGASGYHHILAKNGIQWESDEHVQFADTLFERINRAAVEASADLAAEKGAYEYCENSDWKTGAYFKKRGYTHESWQPIVEKTMTHGVRNAYIGAIAPTSSTSIIAGTTAGIDPVMKKYFLEEKKGTIVPRVAPELSPKTFWFYKNAHQIDQNWSLKAAGARQRHIDQAQSLNLYITTDYTLRQVLELYIKAWEYGLKSIYYVRSQSLEVEECEVCAS